MKYKRILLKLSGESLMGDKQFGIDPERISQYAEDVKQVVAKGVEVIDRLAMILFNIPDIRYFWTNDERFLKQFNGQIINFKPYSKFPPVYKDISLWIEEKFNDGVWYKFNDFCEIIREIGDNSIEEVKLIDEFKKSDKLSHCYRITFRSNDRTLTDEEVNNWYFKIRNKLNELNFNLR